MISKPLEEVINEMNVLNSNIKNAQAEAHRMREKETEYKGYVANAEAKIKNHELALEQMQLKLREVLNTEPPSVKIEQPKEVFDDQIGRQG